MVLAASGGGRPSHGISRHPLQLTHLNWKLTTLVVLLFIELGAGQSTQASPQVQGLSSCTGAPFACDNSSFIFRVGNPVNCTMYFNCVRGVLYPASCSSGQTFDRILYSCTTSAERCTRECSPIRADYINYVFNPAHLTTQVTTATEASQFNTGVSLTTVTLANISTVSDVADKSAPSTYTTENVAVTATSGLSATSSSRNGGMMTSQNVTSYATSADFAATSLSGFESSLQQSTTSPSNTNASSSTSAVTRTQQASSSVVTSSTATSSAGPTSSFQTSTSSYTNSAAIQTSSISGTNDERTHNDMQSTVSVSSSTSSSAELTNQSSSSNQASSTQSMQSVSSSRTTNVFVTSVSTQLPQGDRTGNTQVTSTHSSVLISGSQPQLKGNDTTTTTTTASDSKTTTLPNTTAQQVTNVLLTDVQHLSVSTIQNDVTQNVTGSVTQLASSTQFISSSGSKPNTNTTTLLPASTIRNGVTQNVTGSVTQLAPSTQLISGTVTNPNSDIHTLLPIGSSQPLSDVTQFTTITLKSTGQYAEYSTVPSNVTATSVPQPTSSTGNQGVRQNATQSDLQGTSEGPLTTSSYVTMPTIYVEPANVSHLTDSQSSPSVANLTASYEPSTEPNTTPAVTSHDNDPVTTSQRAIIDQIVTSSSGSNVALEGSSYSLTCSFRIRHFDGLLRVNRFVWSRDGQQLVPGPRIQISSDKKADNDGWWNSTLMFANVVPSFAGQVTCYVQYNGGYVQVNDFSIVVIPLPKIQISPLTLTVRRGQRFVISCDLVGKSMSPPMPSNPVFDGNPSAVTATTTPSRLTQSDQRGVWFTWFLYGSPATNSSGATVSSRDGTSTMNATALNDVMVSCMASNVAGNSTIASANVTVVSETDAVCDENIAGGIKWMPTKSDTISYSPCPPTTTGVAFRRCVLSSGFPGVAMWLPPNIDNCVDNQLKDLQDQLNDLEQGVGFNNASNLNTIASMLDSYTTQTSELSAVNLKMCVNLIKQLATIHMNNIGVAASRDEIKSVINVASNLLQPWNMNSWNILANNNQTGSSLAVDLMASVDTYGDQLVLLLNSSNTSMIQFTTENLMLQATLVTTDRLINLPSPVDGGGWLNSSTNRFTLTSDTMKSIANYVGSNDLSMYTVIYRNIDQILPVNRSTSAQNLNSQIMALSITGLDSTALLAPPITFMLTNNIAVESRNLTANCVFWNFSAPPNGDWSTTNCSVLSRNSTHTQCQCSHLTNFAILMSPSPIDNTVLSIISLVGCSLSIAALTLTIIIYAAMWKYFKSHHAVVLINFCIAMIIANAIFLGGVNQTQSKVTCLVIAVLLHYFYLVTFCMMLAEGVEMLLYIVYVFHIQRKAETAALIFAAWFIPVIIVGISLAVTRTEGYGSDTSCWLSVKTGLIWAFVAPALLILLVNFIILILVLYRISRSKFSTNKNEQKNRVQATMWNILVLCPILGITWVFGVLSVNNDLVAFQYIFAVANSLQGVFVFIFHALCHNRKAKGSYSTRRPICFDMSRSKSGTTKSYKSGSHTNSNSNSDSTHNIVTPYRRSTTSKSRANNRPTNGTFSDMPSHLQSLGQYDVVDYPHGHASFRPPSVASDTTVSTDLSTSVRSTTTLVTSSMDFTYL